MDNPKWVAVPVEPTPEMLTQGANIGAWHDDAVGSFNNCAENVYEAMLAAAPQSHVAVKRELLERAISFVETASIHVPALRDAPHLVELRALLKAD